MKKFFTILAISLFVFAGVFAQSASTGGKAENSDSYADSTTRTIDIEDKYPELHPSATNVTIQLEYTPLTGEVRLYYTCMAATFDQGEAMITAQAVYDDFAKENKYKHYTYKAKDKTKYFKEEEKNVRMATYSSYVLFTR